MLNILKESITPETQTEKLEEIQKFKASYGWLKRFMDRFDLVQRRITGTGRTLPKDCKNQINHYLNQVQSFAKLYDPKCIFNFYESSFYMDSPGTYSIEKRGNFNYNLKAK